MVSERDSPHASPDPSLPDPRLRPAAADPEGEPLNLGVPEEALAARGRLRPIEHGS